MATIEDLVRHFTVGTQNTITLGHLGCEVETHFVQIANGHPITARQSLQIMNHAAEFKGEAKLMLDLGRQCIELAVDPCTSAEELLERAHRLLAKLYRIARSYGAEPFFEPIMRTGTNLLDASDPRDQLFRRIDGPDALNVLCRTASVQFTIQANPRDAIQMINRLFAAGIHHWQDEVRPLWQTYIAMAHIGYRTNRYGGPKGFYSIEHYCTELANHNVIMHQDRMVNSPITDLGAIDIELFLRSVWWFFRLRRYGDNLAVEIRPLARYSDDRIEDYLEGVFQAIAA